jgi:hypothetical protein
MLSPLVRSDRLGNPIGLTIRLILFRRYSRSAGTMERRNDGKLERRNAGKLERRNARTLVRTPTVTMIDHRRCPTGCCCSIGRPIGPRLYCSELIEPLVQTDRTPMFLFRSGEKDQNTTSNRTDPIEAFLSLISNRTDPIEIRSLVSNRTDPIRNNFLLFNVD